MINNLTCAAHCSNNFDSVLDGKTEKFIGVIAA